ncbi:hypothetical protein D3C76_694180 [compost metagenome]|uniref:Transposase InsH N-terminal domain-containing protein n=1 Tax=Pseudomonas jinjuensis TaxID=198616 RepID=A0A1H0BWI9_9PSED|nr:hypothetical protein SAMN05216193_103219 [Pseudomonas jinjuensis]
MLSLFADQEREAKLDSLGDPLALLNKHVDFAALAAEIDRWAPRPSRSKGGRPPYPTELMTRLLLQAAAVEHMTALEAKPERIKSFFQDPFVKYAA